MKRLFGILVCLIAVLIGGWGCFGREVAGISPEKEPTLQFYPADTLPPATESASAEETVCHIRHASVIARRLVSYDGPFFEDGTEEELVGVAALELRNTGSAVVEYVEAVVFQPQQTLHFEATFIPPGGTVLVLEKDRQAYNRQPVLDLQCPTVVPMPQSDSGRQVQIVPDGSCNLVVENLTQEQIGCVRVFYKQYYAEEELLLGGVTYCLVLTDLQPGQSRRVSPAHFASQYSRVVAVVVEP